MATIIKNTDSELQIVLHNCDHVLANTLRRIMIAQVPTLAIEFVQFSDNTTVLPEEFIAHRLGLLPIKGELEEAKILFDKTAGPDVEEWSSGDLQLPPGIELVHSDIPLIKANKGQRLAFVAITKKGCGEEHAKWSPVSTCFFKAHPKGTLLHIESVGQLSPMKILKTAFEILDKKLETCIQKATIQVI